MTSNRLIKTAFVSGVAATTLATLVFATDNTMGARPTTGNKPETAMLNNGAKASFRKSAGCNVRIVSYFDNASLERINNTFGDLSKWIKDRGLDDVPAVVEQVFGEKKTFSRQDNILMEDFGKMIGHFRQYKAGTKAGLAYLQQSPQNVVDTGLILIAGGRALKEMMTDKAALEFGAKFDKEFSRINRALLSTQQMIDSSKFTGCDKIPVPAQRPAKTEEKAAPAFYGQTRLTML